MPRAVLLLFLFSACWGGGKGTPVVVGSLKGSLKDADATILGERLARQLEDAGCIVERRFDLAGSKAADSALTGGAIDAYVESQRVALLEILGEPEPQTMRVETALRPLYVNRGLFWSPPLGIGDLAVVYRRDIDQKCREASRAIMRLAYVGDEPALQPLRRASEIPADPGEGTPNPASTD